MVIQSTLDRSRKWRVWHSTNYNIGGISFFFGSILLFPYFNTVLPAGLSGLISAWLYTIGSFTFTLADFTQWSHYERKLLCLPGACCEHANFSINFFLSFTGSFLYLVGSADFLPYIDEAQQGLYLFIIASVIIVFSQSWKIGRVVKQGYKQNKILEALKEDLSGVIVDTFAGLGSLMYLIGSYLFFNTDPVVQIIAAAVFSTGGFFFYLSGAFMLKRYFLDPSENHGSFQVVNTQAKLQERQSANEITN